MQGKKYSKAIAALAFLFCAAVGFGVVKLIGSSDNKPQEETISTPGLSEQETSTATATKDDSNISDEETNSQTVEAIEDLDRILDKEGIPSKPEKTIKEKKTEKASEKRVKEVAVKPKMSSSEVHNMLKKGDYVGNDKLSPNFRINVTGMRSGERTPESSMDVHDKLRTEQWEGFSVTNVQYDEQGRVSSVTIKPIYPNV